MRRQSHLLRVKSLEDLQAMANDAQVLKWGETVTDDELRRIADGEVSGGASLNRKIDRGANDSVLYLIVKPFVEALRADKGL